MSENPPTWDHDIKKLFNEHAVQCMKLQKNLDLSSYDDVKSKGPLILEMISIIPPSTVPRMPPDPKDSLSKLDVETFKRWTETGYKKS